jgi:hypothetical protein
VNAASTTRLHRSRSPVACAGSYSSR